MAKIEKKEVPYTQINNKLLNDKDISLKAKGLYSFMYSKPNNWNFTIKSMVTQLKDGYDAIQRGLQELKAKGWVEYKKLSNGTGIYTLQVEPKTEKPKLDNPIMGKPPRISNKDIINKKDRYKEKIKKEINYSDFSLVNQEACEEWFKYKKYKTKAPITKTLNFLSKYPKETQQQIVNTSIMNGYKGLFPPKQQFKKTLDEKNNEFLDKYFDEAIDTEVIK